MKTAIDHVRLGFEVGTGEAVDIPIGHMVVCGQTQRSGKTTALDALVDRAGRQAIAFVTKRGEGALSGARTIPPYFRERSDWQFVESVLESAMKQKMRFERAWIIRAARGAKSLADVRRNVTALAGKAKGGMNADMYMLLGEYLDLVVPLIAKLPITDTIRFPRQGLAVMNLIAYPVELQALVIRSTIEWIHANARDTLILIPEAWKFVPRDRGAPVKLAAASIAREGATLHNFLWIDSQDITGADYEVLRQASVWLLGVQREANEIKRALKHLPADVKKPKPSDIASLKLGQFWACTPEGARLVYVQPKWLTANEARLVATGMMPAEYAHRKAAELIPAGHGGKFEDLDPGPLLATARTVKMPDRWPTPSTENEPEEDEMKPEEMKQLAHMIGEAVGERIDGIRSHVDRLLDEQRERERRGALEAKRPPALDKTSRAISKAAGVPVGPETGTHQLPSLADEEAAEAVYQRFKARLAKEAPALVQLLVEKAEIQVAVDRKPVRIDGQSLRGRIGRLIVAGFFEEPRTSAAIVGELRRRGGGRSDSAHSPRELQWFTEAGFLTLEGDGHQAVPDERKRITILGE